jgi:hypothetical protein
VKQPSIKDQLQKCFEENPFDASLSSTNWSKSSITGQSTKRDGNVDPPMVLEIPTFDLMAALPTDVHIKLVRCLYKNQS